MWECALLYLGRGFEEGQRHLAHLQQHHSRSVSMPVRWLHHLMILNITMAAVEVPYDTVVVVCSEVLPRVLHQAMLRLSR